MARSVLTIDTSFTYPNQQQHQRPSPTTAYCDKRDFYIKLCAVSMIIFVNVILSLSEWYFNHPYAMCFAFHRTVLFFIYASTIFINTLDEVLNIRLSRVQSVVLCRAVSQYDWLTTYLDIAISLAVSVESLIWKISIFDPYIFATSVLKLIMCVWFYQNNILSK